MAQPGTSAPQLPTVLDRSADPARGGLVEACDAVSALRARDLLVVERLPELAEHYRRDLGLPLDLVVEGEARALPADVSATLYRVAGEALTNVIRHAPGAPTRMVLAWESAAVRLRVSDAGGGSPNVTTGSGGWGLTGMTERVARVGGSASAGPDGTGWTVEVTVPAP